MPTATDLAAAAVVVVVVGETMSRVSSQFLPITARSYPGAELVQAAIFSYLRHVCITRARRLNWCTFLFFSDRHTTIKMIRSPLAPAIQSWVLQQCILDQCRGSRKPFPEDKDQTFLQTL